MEDLIGSMLGWLGTIGTFSAYVLIWRGFVDATAKRYSFLNAVGGFMASAGALAYGAWPAVASNLVWGLIGVQGLISSAMRKREAGALSHPATSQFTSSFEGIVLPPSHEWNPNLTNASSISLPWLHQAPSTESLVLTAEIPAQRPR